MPAPHVGRLNRVVISCVVGAPLDGYLQVDIRLTTASESYPRRYCVAEKTICLHRVIHCNYSKSRIYGCRHNVKLLVKERSAL